MSRGLGCALLASMLLAVAGCEAPVAATRPDRQAYTQALETLGRDEEAGVEALRAFLAARPGSSLADDAALRLSQVLARRGDESEAVEHLSWALRLHPEGDKSDEARLLLAELQRRRGHPGAAYRTASKVRLSLLPQKDRAAAHRLLADLAGEAGEPTSRLRWLALVRADQADAAAARAVDQELEETLLGLSDAELDEVAEQLGRRVPAGRARLRQAELRLQDGDLEGAERALQQARRLPLSEEGAARLAEVEASLRSGGMEAPPGPGELPDGHLVRGTVGVALPLSGPLAPVGEHALEGIILASGAVDAAVVREGELEPDAAARGGLRLLVRDTGGDPTRAAEVVAALADDPEVLAIVGPLTAAEAESAASEADRGSVPLLALTRRGEVAEGRPFVFRLGLAPEDEVEVLADYAVHGLGLRRLALLYPRDEYGRSLRALFWDAVEARGARVVGVASYEVDATDFSEPIKGLVGYRMLDGGVEAALARRAALVDKAKRLPPKEAAALRARAAEVRAPDGSPLPPHVDFEGLFVPDAHEMAGLIAPALAFHAVRGVRLLGPGGWNDPELLALGGAHVEGAVFTGAVHRESEERALADFAARFRAGFGREPDALAAQSYDAVLLVVRELLEGQRSRRAIQRGLLSAEPLRGVSGSLVFDAEGNARRRPHLLGVEGGRIVSVDALGRPPLLPGAQAPEPPSVGSFSGGAGR